MADGLSPSHHFVAPDSGPGRTLYTCSFHWFQVSDGRTIGLDVIRSEDTGTLGLRVFLAGPDGVLRALVYEAPLSEWQPFVTQKRPVPGGGQNVLGRGTNWIAGAVRCAGQGFSRVEFDLDLQVLSPAEGPGPMALDLVRLTATDYMKVRTTGRILLDDESLDIDAIGPASVHYGQNLPEYAYLVTVPPVGAEDPSRPGILVSSIRGDDFKFGGQLLNGQAITYAYYAHACGGALPLSLHLGQFGPGICLGEGRTIELSDIVPFRHQLMGMPTWTATATASLLCPALLPIPWPWGEKKNIPLGRVVLDLRGAYYTSILMD